VRALPTGHQGARSRPWFIFRAGGARGRPGGGARRGRAPGAGPRGGAGVMPRGRRLRGAARRVRPLASTRSTSPSHAARSAASAAPGHVPAPLPSSPRRARRAARCAPPPSCCCVRCRPCCWPRRARRRPRQTTAPLAAATWSCSSATRSVGRSWGGDPGGGGGGGGPRAGGGAAAGGGPCARGWRTGSWAAARHEAGAPRAPAEPCSSPPQTRTTPPQERDPQDWPEGWADANLPGMARLKKNGLTFKRAYTNAAMCTAARACLFTGYFNPQHNARYVLEQDMPSSLYPQVGGPRGGGGGSVAAWARRWGAPSAGCWSRTCLLPLTLVRRLPLAPCFPLPCLALVSHIVSSGEVPGAEPRLTPDGAARRPQQAAVSPTQPAPHSPPPSSPRSTRPSTSRASRPPPRTPATPSSTRARCTCPSRSTPTTPGRPQTPRSTAGRGELAVCCLVGCLVGSGWPRPAVRFCRLASAPASGPLPWPRPAPRLSPPPRTSRGELPEPPPPRPNPRSWNYPDGGANQSLSESGGSPSFNDKRFMESTGTPQSGNEGALQWILEQAVKSQPFFLVISLINPHDGEGGVAGRGTGGPLEAPDAAGRRGRRRRRVRRRPAPPPLYPALARPAPPLHPPPRPAPPTSSAVLPRPVQRLGLPPQPAHRRNPAALHRRRVAAHQGGCEGLRLRWGATRVLLEATAAALGAPAAAAGRAPRLTPPVAAPPTHPPFASPAVGPEGLQARDPGRPRAPGGGGTAGLRQLLRQPDQAGGPGARSARPWRACAERPEGAPGRHVQRIRQTLPARQAGGCVGGAPRHPSLPFAAPASPLPTPKTDEYMVKTMNALDATGLTKKTVIVRTADHGEVGPRGRGRGGGVGECRRRGGAGEGGDGGRRTAARWGPRGAPRAGRGRRARATWEPHLSAAARPRPRRAQP
jgi:hypothetical protein